MKVTGRCFREFPEFPILPFDPAAFGFANDTSDRHAEPGCPSFTTEDGRYTLWWNWPHPAEREWYGPMSGYFITDAPTDGTAPRVLFHCEEIRDLVEHLIEAQYAPKPALRADCSQSLHDEWRAALKCAGLDPLRSIIACARTRRGA